MLNGVLGTAVRATGAIGGTLARRGTKKGPSFPGATGEREAKAVFARFESGDSQTVSDDGVFVH